MFLSNQRYSQKFLTKLRQLKAKIHFSNRIKFKIPSIEKMCLQFVILDK